MSVVGRLVLVLCVLAGQTPVCKIAVARSFARPTTTTTTAAAQLPPQACKKGCCAAHRPAKPATPVRDSAPPAGPGCPVDCLSPLCTPLPVMSEIPTAVVRDAGAAGTVTAAACPFPSDAYPVPLDRPPRV